MPRRLEGKVACITGAGSGLGRSIAQRFALEGATVVAQDVSVETASETIELLPDGAHLVVGGDVADPDAVSTLFALIAEKFGRIDVQVNNAGVGHLPGDGFDEMRAGDGPQISLMSYGAFTQMLSIHVGGTFLCTQGAIGLMGNGGSVINMSSIAGLAGWGAVHYSAAKGAILGFTRAACRELGTLGIRINAIAPGVIDTPMTAQIDEDLLAPMIITALLN